MVVTIVNGVTATNEISFSGINLPATSLLGNPTSVNTDAVAVTLGSGLAFSGTTLVSSGLTVSSAAFNFNTTSNIFTHTGGNIVGVTTFTGSGNYTLLNNDYCLVVNKVTGAATTVLLLASPETGRLYKIKDGKLDAGTNNITISGNGKNIDSASTYVINTSGSAIELIYNSVQWNLI